MSQNFPILKNDLIIRAARGENVEKVPVWVMRQAGRYDPEFRKVREKADFFTICRTPELAAKVTLQPINRYDGLIDAAIIFSDILVIPQAMGLVVEMHDGKGGLTFKNIFNRPFFPKPLETPLDLERLYPSTDVNKELKYVFEAITLVRHQLNGRVPLIGFAGAPWTLMAYMIEGGGSKMFSKVKTWLFKYPEASHTLLKRITTVIIDYLYGQIVAGAQLLQVFDSWAGELSFSDFQEFSLPYLKNISQELRSICLESGIECVPLIVFAKGAHESLTLLSEIGYDVVSLDWTIDPIRARRELGNNITLQGNMDPGCLYGTPESIRKNVKKQFEMFGKRRWIANLGHGMQPDHIPEALLVYLESVKEFSAEF